MRTTAQEFTKYLGKKRQDVHITRTYNFVMKSQRYSTFAARLKKIAGNMHGFKGWKLTHTNLRVQPEVSGRRDMYWVE